MPRHLIPARCHRCGVEGVRSDYAWMAHADFCWSCMDALVAQGAAVPDRGPTFVLTDVGARRFPELETVAECPMDGMPIYRRWVDAGVAQGGAAPLCPHCLGTTHLLP